MILALGSVSLSAQSLSEAEIANINKRLGEYFEYTKVNDYTNMMDYIYPKIYTLATKEQLVEVFNGLETMGLGLNVDEISATDPEPLIEEDDRKFAVIDYKVKIRLELLTATVRNDQVIESLKSSFKVGYNATNMSYDDETHILSFDGQKYALAVMDPEYDANEWYFLEYDASNPMAAQMMLSDKVLEKFKAKMGQ